MDRVMNQRGADRLQQRDPLSLDPRANIAIKRDVHEFEVSVDAALFAEVFADLLSASDSTFGLIRVKRPAARIGEDFEVGERFQGCFSLAQALRRATAARPLLARTAERLLALAAVRRIIQGLEDHFLSDYAEIVDIERAPDLEAGEPYRFEYRYLDGTPIAGSSIFTVVPVGAGRCRVTQVFEYQEQNAIAMTSFQRMGLKFHDQVVYQQVHQAASLLGATAEGTIPTAYGEL